MAWSSCLPVDLVSVDSSKPHPFGLREAATVESNPAPVKITKCPPWTEEDEYRRSGASGRLFAYQWGTSAKLRAAIPAFNLKYYDER